MIITRLGMRALCVGMSFLLGSALYAQEGDAPDLDEETTVEEPAAEPVQEKGKVAAKAKPKAGAQANAKVPVQEGEDEAAEDIAQEEDAVDAPEPEAPASKEGEKIPAKAPEGKAAQEPAIEAKPEDVTEKTEAETPAPEEIPKEVEEEPAQEAAEKTEAETPVPEEAPKEAKEAPAQAPTEEEAAQEVVEETLEEEPEPEPEPEELEGIDTVDLSDPQGNWLFKRIWWHKAEEKYEKLRGIVEQIMESRLSFFAARNDIDRDVLDPFYVRTGFDRGKLTATLENAKEQLEAQREQATKNEPLQASITDAIGVVESTQTQIKAVEKLDEAVNNSLNLLMEQIKKVHAFEQEAWSNFKEIARVLNDKKARDLYHAIEIATRNIKDLQQYINESFAASFQEHLERINSYVQEIEGKLGSLSQRGIDLKAGVARIRQKQDERRAQEEAEEEEEPKEVGFFQKWVFNPVRLVVGVAVDIVLWPVKKLLVLVRGEAAEVAPEDEEEVSDEQQILAEGAEEVEVISEAEGVEAEPETERAASEMGPEDDAVEAGVKAPVQEPTELEEGVPAEAEVKIDQEVEDEQAPAGFVQRWITGPIQSIWNRLTNLTTIAVDMLESVVGKVRALFQRPEDQDELEEAELPEVDEQEVAEPEAEAVQPEEVERAAPAEQAIAAEEEVVAAEDAAATEGEAIESKATDQPEDLLPPEAGATEPDETEGTETESEAITAAPEAVPPA